MIQNARADMVAGLMICAVGIFIVIYAHGNYPMGTMRRMGPGMFPAGLGAVLSLLGMVLALNSWRSLRANAGHDWPPVRFELRTAGLTVAGVVAFAVLLRPMGLIPAVIAVVCISALSDARNKPLGIVVLALVLVALATVIFKFGLGLSFSLIAWNWS